jgi:hypothetical protein
MNYTEIAVALIAIVGNIIVGFFVWMTRSGASRDRQLTNFYNQLLVECQSLRTCNMELQNKLASVSVRMNDLQAQLQFYEDNTLLTESRDMLANIFEKFVDAAAWIHDVSSNKWYLNEKYCVTFHVKRVSFWTPVNILGQYDAADVIDYMKNDLAVIETGTMMECVERVRVRIMDPHCDDYMHYKIRKTPFFINNRPYIVGSVVAQVHSP